VLLRGHSANPWDLRPWELLQDRYEVMAAVTGSNLHDLRGLALPRLPVRALRDLLPRGPLGVLAVRLPGDRYLALARHLEGARIVHAAEIDPWFTRGAARLRRRMGFRLVATVWETIPFLGAYRAARGRRYRAETMGAIDLFLATTERARQCLLLEGAPPERIRVHPPGVDREAFAGGAAGARGERLIVSPGRLVWEKGHQDVMRALAALERGLVRGPAGEWISARLLVIGSGPEEARLRRYAADLGLDGRVELRRTIPYSEMPAVYARAACVVLASLPTRFWEEQFGMVLAEALAAGVPVAAAASGAIPEVVGADATLFRPGDWMGLARALATGPLAAAPDARSGPPDPARVQRYSTAAAAERLAAVYAELLG
jgi:glycosyltransferase involved in cell wall biosynthesis